MSRWAEDGIDDDTKSIGHDVEAVEADVSALS